MIQTFFFLSLVTLLLGAAGAILCGKRSATATVLGAAGAMVGGLLAAIAGLHSLLHHQTFDFLLPWNMPGGAIQIHLDALAAFFMLPIGVLSAVTALFGTGYLRKSGSHGKGMGVHWLFFNLLIASMICVVCASQTLLFLLSWEIMSLASFFLVMFDAGEKQVRSAGWMYLVTTHIGMVFLLLFFLVAQTHAQSPFFGEMAQHGFSKTMAGFLFIFALIGFGLKAGLVPFHVWLPEAHPAAPSHVSALMSGIMIKMGIYGIVRALLIIGPPELWWGYLLIALGSISGILGVLYALGQHDLKRLLAYHSVENIGIITLGLGCGVTGTCLKNPILAYLGYSGALLHVINHALFKGLLFLGAGSVLKATGTTTMDRLGGLLKRMPATALFFLIGSIAICGIPPLNGFISEFLIYFGAFNGISSGSLPQLLSGTFAALSLALIGGLALACFAKAFGIVFLGEPRTPQQPGIRDPGPAMVVSMVVLAALCVLIGIGFPAGTHLLAQPVALLCPASDGLSILTTSSFNATLYGIIIGASALLLTIGLLTLARKRLLKNKSVQTGVTWDCGYTRPTARMQYTATSFAQPLTDFFNRALSSEKHLNARQDYFPKAWRFASHVNDFFLERIYTPLFNHTERILGKLRWLQGGRVHIYILYITLTIVFLVAGELLWKR